MKKIMVIVFVIIGLMLFSTAAFGLNTPAVSKGHGVITGRYVTEDLGFRIGGEYGFTDKLGMAIDLGQDSFMRLGGKYEVNSSIAIEAGVQGSSKTNFFFGVDGAIPIAKNLQGIGQADIVFADGSNPIFLEVGLKYNLDRQLDIRGGVFVVMPGQGSNITAVQIGVGYKF